MKHYRDRNALIRTILPDSIVAEVGTQSGDFAAEILKQNPYRLYLIDIWKQQGGDYEADPANVSDAEHEAKYQAVLRRFAREIEMGQVVVLRMDSLAATAEMPDGILDVVYLDANHTKAAVAADLRALAPKMNEVGRIMGHDYTESAQAKKMKFGVVEAVKEFCLEGEWRMIGITDDEWPSYELERVSGNAKRETEKVLAGVA